MTVTAEEHEGTGPHRYRYAHRVDIHAAICAARRQGVPLALKARLVMPCGRVVPVRFPTSLMDGHERLGVFRDSDLCVPVGLDGSLYDDNNAEYVLAAHLDNTSDALTLVFVAMVVLPGEPDHWCAEDGIGAYPRGRFCITDDEVYGG